MPNGVEIHGKQLRVYFRHQGELCREPLNLEPSPANVTHAENLVSVIHHEIQAGTFDYGRHFPNSKRLQENTVNAWLNRWLDIKKRQVAASTMISYRGVTERYMRPAWGSKQADKIDTVDLEEWISNDLERLASKTIKETVAVLRLTRSQDRAKRAGYASLSATPDFARRRSGCCQRRISVAESGGAPKPSATFRPAPSGLPSWS